MMDTAAIKDRLSQVMRYTPPGLVRWIRLKLTSKEIAVTGQCYQCGRCCTRLNLSYRDRWIRKVKDFWDMSEAHPEYSRFHITGKTFTGLLIFECDCIGKDGLCTDHESRPDICRDYPERDLVFTGGELLEHCGYRFIETPLFSKELERAKKSVEDGCGDREPELLNQPPE